MHFIGIDIGTTTICGVIYDFINKRMEMVTKENDSTLKTSNHWEKLQDPDRILIIVKDILDYFTGKYKDIKGIGLTGQMHGILYVDKNGNSLSKLISWQDGRGNLVFKNKLSYASYLNLKTNHAVSSGFGLVTHFYNQMNCLIPGKAYKICTIMDYVAMKLSGNNFPLIDTTNAAGFGLFNLEETQFDLGAIKKVKINSEILPQIIRSFDAIGVYDNKIPVYPAIGDNQASFLGSVKHLDKSILINIGTSGQISTYSRKLIKADFLDKRPFPGGGYILVGASLCGGNSFSFLKEFFEKTTQLFCDSPNKINDFYKLANSINLKNYYDKNLLKVDTLFEGTRSNPDIKGSIGNISLDNFTPQNLIVGFFSGVVDELHDYAEKIPDKVIKTKDNLIGSGNAIRKNSLLCRILEEKFGKKLNIPSHNEEAAFGACLCAIVGGRYSEGFNHIGNLVEYTNNINSDS